MELYTWAGIVFCISQSAMFSGLNLAFFSISRLRLEVEAETGRKSARQVLEMRKDSNFMLTTVLWGNVSVNVLLALLSDSLLTGVGAFFFSAFVITIIGEILPQGYFSRHSLKMASLLLPLFRFYQFLLYPIAKPTAKLLDWWLGAEGIQYFRERDLRELIRKHIEASEADIDRIEGLGALNFLAIDDMIIRHEGEPVDPKSVIILPLERNFPVIPEFQRDPADPFIQKINASGKKWVIITDEEDEPQLVLDADGFLRAALIDQNPVQPLAFCHRPIVVKDPLTKLGTVIWRLKVKPETAEDDVIDQDVILVWSETDRVIITGADILGRLLRGIVTRALR
jgi:metal transporter CNNM